MNQHFECWLWWSIAKRSIHQSALVFRDLYLVTVLCWCRELRHQKGKEELYGRAIITDSTVASLSTLRKLDRSSVGKLVRKEVLKNPLCKYAKRYEHLGQFRLYWFELGLLDWLLWTWKTRSQHLFIDTSLMDIPPAEPAWQGPGYFRVMSVISGWAWLGMHHPGCFARVLHLEDQEAKVPARHLVETNDNLCSNLR